MKQLRNLILPVAALALVACDGFGTGPSSDQARVSILLTDAPGDFHAAVVTVTDIYLQPAEGEDAERVYLRQGEGITTDLLTLSNDVLELVENKTVPAGSYEQLRFVITGGYIEVETATGTAIYASSPSYEGLPDGANVTGSLQMPSMAQSGLKVNLVSGDDDEDGAVTLEGEQTLLVDFDVSQSFGKAAGQSGKWVMRPALKATVVEAAANVTVSVTGAEGLVLPTIDGTALTLGSFKATLTPAAGGDAKVVAITDADANGVFEAKFLYLFSGNYNVGFVGPDGVTVTMDKALPVSVSVAAGASETVTLVLNSATVQ